MSGVEETGGRRIGLWNRARKEVDIVTSRRRRNREGEGRRKGRERRRAKTNQEGRCRRNQATGHQGLAQLFVDRPGQPTQKEAEVPRGPRVYGEGAGAQFVPGGVLDLDHATEGGNGAVAGTDTEV